MAEMTPPALAEVAATDLVGVGRLIGEDAVARLDQRRALGASPEPRPCRLVAVADGWVAANLARPDDVGPWEAVEPDLRQGTAADAAAAGQELGIPVAVVNPPDHEDEQTHHRGQRFPMAPFVLGPRGTRAPQPPAETTVVDLTALWAGPLATSILLRAGARVQKVTSVHRPDGSDDRFFAALNDGKEAVILDFRTDAGRADLARLCGAADVVVTASRPRAIDQLGLDPDRWPLHVAITGYGWTGPWATRVAFGDDAAAAAGWAWGDPPGLRGDAVADPIAGLYAAAATLAALDAGWCGRIDVALRDAANHVVGEVAP